MHTQPSSPAVPAVLVRPDTTPPLLPLLADARSADPRRGPVALAALLALTAPQLARIITLWMAGTLDTPPGGRDLLMTEVQLHLVTLLETCEVESESAFRAWISVNAIAWLVRHAGRARGAAQRAALLRAAS